MRKLAQWSLIIFLAAGLSCTATELVLADDALYTPECANPVQQPSIEHARLSFSALDYGCAIQELRLWLGQADSARRAEAYRLLSAAEYYYLLDRGFSADSIKEQITQTGVMAYRADPNWVGEFDIPDEEYVSWMKDAQQTVRTELADLRAQEVADSIRQASGQTIRKPDQAVAEDSTSDSESSSSQEKKELSGFPKAKTSAWYKSKWAIGTGSAVVVGVVVAILTRHRETTEPFPLPPNPPAK